MLNWQPAQRRTAPLGGEYVARISATTATENGSKIIRGFNTTSTKGAGIRVYEYASNATIARCRLQLEALVWLCVDAETVLTNYGMTPADVITRKVANLNTCAEHRLLDIERLVEARALNKKG
ncbi:MAG: BstXI family restriction endonuclease [Anaerolineaceae bacterium]|nr:BstXI family restriction endonuclease [Anaerolineaceae bacterium]